MGQGFKKEGVDGGVPANLNEGIRQGCKNPSKHVVGGNRLCILCKDLGMIALCQNVANIQRVGKVPRAFDVFVDKTGLPGGDLILIFKVSA